MEDYSANTRKTADISQPPAEKRAEKVITGEARVKKKSGFDKAIRAFLPNEVQDVKSYIWGELFVPYVKRFLADSVGALLGVDIGIGDRNRRRRPADRVDYGRIYRDERRDGGYSRPRSEYENEEIIFVTRMEAEEVLRRMYEALDRYGNVSINDLYDFAGVTVPWPNCNYGWRDLYGATTVADRDGGFKIKLPRAIPL